MTEINMNAIAADPADRRRNLEAIVAELAKKQHVVQRDVNFGGIKVDALIDRRIIILKTKRFRHQIKDLENKGYVVYVTPAGSLSPDQVEGFVNALEIAN